MSKARTINVRESVGKIINGNDSVAVKQASMLRLDAEKVIAWRNKWRKKFVIIFDIITEEPAYYADFCMKFFKRNVIK